MSIKSNLLKAGALGLVATALTAGAAFAATATSTVIIDTLSPGDYVAVTGQSNGWCEVAIPGPNGWVNCAYLTSSGYNRPFHGPRYNEAPSVSLSFGTGGFGVGVGVGHPPIHHAPYWNRPWWY